MANCVKCGDETKHVTTFFHTGPTKPGWRGDPYCTLCEDQGRKEAIEQRLDNKLNKLENLAQQMIEIIRSGNQTEVSTMDYVNPKFCMHANLADKDYSDNSVSILCEDCQLEGKPIKIGLSKTWARHRAYSSFYKIAIRVDYPTGGGAILFFVAVSHLVGCTACPSSFDFNDKDDQSETVEVLDGGEDLDSDDSDTETDSDTEPDTDTDLDGFCPWSCHADVGPGSCSPDDIVDSPPFVHNKNFECKGADDICCQPWPPIDELGIGDYCLDFAGMGCLDECEIGGPDTEKVCFNSNLTCCTVPNG